MPIIKLRSVGISRPTVAVLYCLTKGTDGFPMPIIRSRIVVISDERPRMAALYPIYVQVSPSYTRYKTQGLSYAHLSHSMFIITDEMPMMVVFYL